VPGNAGPLNTPRLLHEALTLMRDASPAYAHRFIAYVDALLRLEPSPGAGTPKKDPPRSPRRS